MWASSRFLVANIARRIDGAIEVGARALFAHRAVGGKPRIFIEKRAEILCNAVPQVARQLDPAGESCLHINVSDGDVAFGNNDIRCGVVDQSVGAQIALAEIGAHISFGDNRPVIILALDDIRLKQDLVFLSLACRALQRLRRLGWSRKSEES